MVYELLQDYFVLDNPASGFDLFLKIYGHIVHGHVLPLVSCLLVALRLLTLEKQTGGIQPIAIGKVIYWLITCTLVILIKDTFVDHVLIHTNLGWQCWVKTMVHGVRVMLDLHPKWVVL
jgi:hypothetical protein